MEGGTDGKMDGKMVGDLGDWPHLQRGCTPVLVPVERNAARGREGAHTLQMISNPKTPAKLPQYSRYSSNINTLW